MPSAIFTIANPVLSQQWRISYGPTNQGGFSIEATTPPYPTSNPITVVSAAASVGLFTERIDADGTIINGPAHVAALDGSTYLIDDTAGTITVVQGPPGPGPGPTPAPGGGTGILLAIGAGVLGLMALAGGRRRRK